MKINKLRGANLVSSLVLCSLLLVSCVAKYQPVRSKDISVSEDYAMLKTEEYTLAVAYKYWIKEPQNLTDHLTALHIVCRNKTTDEVNISPNDFHLLDSDGNQTDIILPDKIASLLIPNEPYYDPLITDQNILGEYKYAAEERMSARSNLMTESFSFGKILPGAKKSGFIFFPRLENENDAFTVSYKGKLIQFVRKKK